MSELDEEIEAQIILKGEMFCRAEGIRWFCADDTFGCGAELPNIHYEEWMSRIQEKHRLQASRLPIPRKGPVLGQGQEDRDRVPATNEVRLSQRDRRGLGRVLP